MISQQTCWRIWYQIESRQTQDRYFPVVKHKWSLVMPIILVVDDSPVDQKLVAGLLERDIDWLVSFADNVEQAIEMVDDIFPDIVVTDLQMPGMSGIELLKIGSEKFPHIPIILITGQGSEELAVQALQAGASSYVPKSMLATTLADTVQQILSLSEHVKNKDRLMDFTTSCRYQFRLENDPKLIPAMIEFIGDSMRQLHLGDPVLIRHVSVAVEEALTNALYHGNLGLDAEQTRMARHAEPGSEEYLSLMSRLKEEPYASRKLSFGMDVSRTQGQFAVRDQGAGFDVGSLPDLSKSSSLADTSHRGLTLINNFMDEVKFNEEGNELRMSLKF
jgi:CheY-like chemotaxis protein/anti-sigma regulatory factor (Ser/Thr protein kinase)